MFRLMRNPFLFDVIGDGGTGGHLSVGEIEDLLKDDSSDESDKTDKSIKDEKDESDETDTTGKPQKESKDSKDEGEGDEEEIDEDAATLKALEEELKDEEENVDEEQLELKAPVRRKDILKKYPNLFKDFPYLETAYYREQAFTELLPTIADAKEAVESREVLNRFEGELMGGDITGILNSVREQDPNSFYTIVDNLFPMLASVDQSAYHHLMGNTVKHTVVSMLQEAKRTNNEVLQGAAQILYQFTFGSSAWEPPVNLSKAVKPEEKGKDDTLTQREQQFAQRQFDTHRNDLNSRVNNAIKSTIESNIDPKNSMTDYVKKNAIRQVQEDLNSIISQDKRFRQMVDKLWERAFSNQFDKNSLDAIRSAYTSKARTLLAPIIKKARIEALRGMGKRVREESSEESDETQTPTRKPRSDNNQRPVGNKNKFPPGMSTLEFLNQD